MKKETAIYRRTEKTPKNNRVYIDESGIDKYSQRERARAPRGIQIFGAISGKRYAQKSFIAAKVESNILAPFFDTGTCDTLLLTFG